MRGSDRADGSVASDRLADADTQGASMVLSEEEEREGYELLLAGILRQAIIDYVRAKRVLLKHKSIVAEYALGSSIRSVEKFFAEPPYDYGDIDFKHLKRLCDEKAEEGTPIHYIDHGEINLKRWMNSKSQSQ